MAKSSAPRRPIRRPPLAREVTSGRRIRLFLDSNVLTGGIVSPWGLDKATLALCAASICRRRLRKRFREESRSTTSLHAEFPRTRAEQLIDAYGRLIQLCKPEVVPHATLHEVQANRNLSVTKRTSPFCWRRSEAVRTGC